MSNDRIVILAGHRARTNVICNALKDKFSICKVIIEDPVARWKFVKRRLKRLGFIRTTGEILFKLLVVPILEFSARGRVRELKEKFEFDESEIKQDTISRVPSVNSPACKKLLQELDPRVAVVCGTRIISEDMLGCVPARFVNTHAGITPVYRGVHGAYWALVQSNRQQCGVTVHLVDKGIDTGGILYQATIEPDRKRDNFVTYGLHQNYAGLNLLARAIEDVLQDRVQLKPSPRGESRLWSHPTIWEYLWYRISRGVK